MAQASAAASKVLITFAAERTDARAGDRAVNEKTCAACFTCVRACPYHAIERAEVRDAAGQSSSSTRRG